MNLTPQFHTEPDTYLERIRAEVPLYDELQAHAVEAIPFPPATVLELGIGTGETTRRLLAAHPAAAVTGLDSSPEMVFRARGLGIEVRLARMEDPLPDGPWDLVIAVLAVCLLDAGQRQGLFRRVREQARSLVLADTDGDALASESGGEVVWRGGEVAVVRADYR